MWIILKMAFCGVDSQNIYPAQSGFAYSLHSDSGLEKPAIVASIYKI
jgi:hypothetical protein